MTDRTVNYPSADPKRHLGWVSIAVFVAGLLLTGLHVMNDSTPDVHHPAIISTAWVSFGLWAGAVVIIAPATASEWHLRTTRVKLARLSWVLGAVMFLIHVMVAFHFAHRWKHANAYAHVTEAAGFGPGIFVSYLFTAVWLTDAAWWTGWSKSYANRPAWVGWTVHTFLTFITFNGTVVYVSGNLRWMAAAVFIVLGATLVWRCLRGRSY